MHNFRSNAPANPSQAPINFGIATNALALDLPSGIGGAAADAAQDQAMEMLK